MPGLGRGGRHRSEVGRHLGPKRARRGVPVQREAPEQAAESLPLLDWQSQVPHQEVAAQAGPMTPPEPADHLDPTDPTDHADLFTATFWDERYASGETTWSGRPNPQLVERVADLEPGRALDAGCGDGSDALWLADEGWLVTAVDVSQVALDRGAARATQAGLADRVVWQQQDLLTWAPDEACFDLVTACFLHLPDLDTVHRRLAAGVRPGGTLLVVLHAHSTAHDGHAWGGVQMFRTPEQVVETLGAGWDVTVDQPHRVVEVDGHEHDLIDVIVRAVRS